MAIKVNEKTKEFHLYNDQISYIIRVLEKNNQLEHLYYGKRITHRESFNHLIDCESRPSCNLFENDHTSSLEHIKQEYPSIGTADYRNPAHTITNEIGSKITNFQYDDFEVLTGKSKLNDLPATYVEQSRKQIRWRTPLRTYN